MSNEEKITKTKTDKAVKVEKVSDTNKVEKTENVKKVDTKVEKPIVKEEVKTENISKDEIKTRTAPRPEFKKRSFSSNDNYKWGVLHIFSSYNNIHLHITDMTGSETLVKVTGGMVTKSDRLKGNPNTAMSVARQVAEGCKNNGLTALHVRVRAVGGHNGPMTPGPGTQASIKMLARYGIKLGRIEDVTPVPHDSCRKKGGRRGRRV